MDLDPTLPAAKALGLPQLRRYLAGEIPIESAAAEAKLATKHYAKRQMTWFQNRMKDWNWREDADFSNIIAGNTENIS